MKPLIGITTGTYHNDMHPESPFAYGQKHTYVDAVTLAGGVPVLVPIASSREMTKELLDRLDGIIFAGGSDLEPNLYGQEVTFAQNTNAPRDTHEVELMKLALAKNTPILAICRGMQLLNVVRGGSLHQDILREFPDAMNHDGHHYDGPGPLVHELTITPNTELMKILGTEKLESNSYHHQAIKDVGENLVVSAKTDDGIIEGLEDTRTGYIVAVQSHPESLVAKGREEWQLLFESFIAAASSKDQRYSGLEKSNLEPVSHSLR